MAKLGVGEIFHHPRGVQKSPPPLYDGVDRPDLRIILQGNRAQFGVVDFARCRHRPIPDTATATIQSKGEGKGKRKGKRSIAVGNKPHRYGNSCAI